MGNKKVIILGASGHARSVIDSLERNSEYKIEGVVDLNTSKGNFESYKILGDDSKLQYIYDSGIKHAVVAIGYMGTSNVREILYKKLKKIGYSFPAVIDQSAILSKDVVIGEGSFIGKGTIINRRAKVGKMCIINTGAIIEHDDIIGEYTHIAVGAVLCGNVKIGSRVLVGANATIIQGVKIGDNVVIGAGTTIIRNIEANKIVVGTTMKDKEN